MTATAANTSLNDAVLPLRHESNLHGHIPALDGLRGLAILMVMLLHFTPDSTAAGSLLRQAVFRLFEGGSAGVDLFFVLSGFLITGILFDAKETPNFFRNFYMRRALRIFPLYYGVLLVLFVLLPCFKAFHGAGVADVQHHQGWFWLYASNLLIAKHNQWPSQMWASVKWLRVDHFWSLAVEEHFYLVWPTIILLLSRKAAVRFCIGCIAAALALRLAIYFHGPQTSDSWIRGYVLTPCRMDALALGGLIALLARGPGGVRALVPAARILAASCGLCSLYFIMKNSPPEGFLMSTFSYTLLALCFGGLLILAIAAAPASLAGRFFSLSGLRTLGKYSYGIYIFHEACRPFFDRVLTVGPHSSLLAVAAYILIASAASFAVAFASWHLFEKHFLKLKRFFDYRGTGRAGV